MDFVPVTKSLNAGASGAKGGKIELTVSEPLGGLIKELKISTKGNKAISILHNAAPTDDGLLWCIRTYGDIRGLFQKNDRVTQTGSNQFVGHSATGSLFGSSMWGLQMPLEKRGQTLTPAKACNGESCWLPLYSDWTNVDAKSSGEQGGTFPFTRPQSVHAWDGRVEKIALSEVPSSRGPSGLEKLTYSIQFRNHLNYELAPSSNVNKSIFPHLWLNLLRSHHADIYLVFGDNTTSVLRYDDLVLGIDQAPHRNRVWAQFCKNDDINEAMKSRTIRYGVNPSHCTEPVNGDVSNIQCRCNYVPQISKELDRSKVIKRVIFNYFNYDVALALEGDKDFFAKALLTTKPDFKTGLPSVLIDVMNRALLPDPTKSRYFRTQDEPLTDTYHITVGTFANMQKSGMLPLLGSP